jgi:ankyrin repeat protein
MDGEEPEVLVVARGDNELIGALRARQPLDAIRSIVEASPHLIRSWDGDGWLPIHHAAFRCSRPEVIRYLLEQYPESIKEKTKDDEYKWYDLPIHLACFLYNDDDNDGDDDDHDAEEDWYEKRLQNLQILHELWPESLQQKNQYGRLPLHSASEASMVRYLVKAWPQAVREADDEGMLPLHRAVGETGSFDAIECLVLECPESVQAKDGMGRIPLHHTKHDTPLDAVQLLVKLCPGCLQARDDEGFLPLHRALMAGYYRVALTPTLKFLSDQWQQAVREKSNDGYLPLHTAIFKSHPVGTIRHLIGMYPESVDAACNKGFIPLHEAARQGSFDTAEFLIGLRPDSVRARSSEGYTPLHEAARKGKLEVAQLLLGNWSEAAQATSNDGWLPIHLAARERASHARDRASRLHVV